LAPLERGYKPFSSKEDHGGEDGKHSLIAQHKNGIHNFSFIMSGWTPFKKLSLLFHPDKHQMLFEARMPIHFSR